MATYQECGWLSNSVNNIVIKDDDNQLSEDMIGWNSLENTYDANAA